MIGTITRLVGLSQERLRLRQSLVDQLRAAGAPIAQLRIRNARGGKPYDLELEKKGALLDMAVDFRSTFGERRLVEFFRHRAAAIIDPFLRSRATWLPGNLSDGDQGGAGWVVFSSNRDDAILVPDNDFYISRGYAEFRAAARSLGTEWAQRDETVVWRGSTTGSGRISAARMSPDDETLLQRTRMCLILREALHVDARFANIVQSADPDLEKRRLEMAGLMGPRIDQTTWLARKYAIDVDGNTNAWSNLFIRLLAGCCVIKIASPRGYRQWYYGALKPWEHFVPVKADMSDLLEKIGWCRENDAECARIAAAGRDFAMRRDFVSQMRLAVETLNSRLGAGQLRDTR